MRRSVLDNKGYCYAYGIMKRWVSNNIKTLDDVKGDYNKETQETNPEQLAAIQAQMARV